MYKFSLHETLSYQACGEFLDGPDGVIAINQRPFYNSFAYVGFEPDQAEFALECAKVIKNDPWNTALVGAELAKLKQVLGPAHFLHWLENELFLTPEGAENYILIAKTFDNPTLFAVLSHEVLCTLAKAPRPVRDFVGQILLEGPDFDTLTAVNELQAAMADLSSDVAKKGGTTRKEAAIGRK